MGYNKTFQDQSEQIDHHLSTLAFVAVVMAGLTSLLGVIGNGLVIWTILTKKNMKTPTNILILNLAVADFLVTVLVAPFAALIVQLPNNSLKTILCKLYAYFWYVSACVSGYTLVVMSLVRCILIVHPVTSKSLITKRRMCLAVAALWIIIMGGYSHVLVELDVVTDEEVEVCDIDTYYHFELMFFVFGYAVPLFIMIIVYGILLIMLRYRTRSLESSTQRNRAHGRVKKMVIVVILCFLLCWLPAHVIFIVYTYGTYPQTDVASAGNSLAISLALFNSCINPILYAFLSSKFRQSFKQTCCCRGNDSHE